MDPHGLSDAENERTQRQQALPELGITGQLKLRSANVCVVGAGGLGSPVISYLAAAGVGSITVIDDDVVEPHNLHRQVIHGMDSVGQPKTASATQLAARLAPECRIVEIRERLDSSTAPLLLAGFDVVVDGSDNFETRFAVDAATAAEGIPVVWGAVLGWNAQVTVIPHAASWGSAHAALTLADIYPDNDQTRQAPNCQTSGVMGAVCGQAGSVMALEAIKLITGLGQPLVGRMSLIDGLRSETRTVSLGSAQSVGDGSETPSAHLEVLREIPAGSIVLDVRFTSERDRKPGPEGSVHLPLERILDISFLASAAVPELEDVSLARPIVTVCAEGPRSIRAARHLAAVGYPVAGFLDGGLP